MTSITQPDLALAQPWSNIIPLPFLTCIFSKPATTTHLAPLTFPPLIGASELKSIAQTMPPRKSARAAADKAEKPQVNGDVAAPKAKGKKSAASGAGTRSKVAKKAPARGRPKKVVNAKTNGVDAGK